MLDKQRTYMVLNYDTSPVSISTRYLNEIIPAGNDDNPTSLPLSLEEIMYINSTTKIFKIGRLRFEPEFEEEIYKELRISNWKDILTNQEIYDILLNPSVERLERILEIDNPMYFDRVYGAYVGLANAGATISSNVENIMKARYKELSRGKRKTEITIRPKEVANDNSAIEDLQKQLADTQAMLAKLMAAQNATADVTTATEPVEDKTPTETPKKKTSSKKSSTAKKD